MVALPPELLHLLEQLNQQHRVGVPEGGGSARRAVYKTPTENLV